MTAAARRIHGPGPAESEWQGSGWFERLDCAPAQTWLARVVRLVVVSPHPDDETLGCGGLMAEATRMGIPVHVVSVTDGEACYADDPAWPATRARHVRRAELDGALSALGVDGSGLVRLDLGDGRVRDREAELEARLTVHLQREDTVLTTWRFDGHPDHEACGRAVRRVAAAIGAHHVEYPVWAWHWIDPAHGDARLRGASGLVLSPGARAAKCRALDAFVSQRARDRGEPILTPRILARFERGIEVLLP